MGRSIEEIRNDIENGGTSLGIEFGSTRIKAVLVDGTTTPVAQGSYEWENRLENGIWTYSLEDIWKGLRFCYQDLAADVKKQYGTGLVHIGSMGISAMMHGYMVFDKAGELLVPFRTWRNTITGEAAKKLTELFEYNIPQRWSIAHLYQAVLNKEEHLSKLDFFTTLAGYIHWKLTGKKVLGVGDASGMFPIDPADGQYEKEMVHKFETLIKPEGYSWKLSDILPKVLTPGEEAGSLTEEGAALLDESGMLQAGVPFCPPEGDAGTGMTATNSVAVRTGNVSAGTSVFAMVVLEENLKKVHEEIDLVTTPDGYLVGMVHCNNCTSDLNAWVGLFEQFYEMMGQNVDKNTLFGSLYRKALEGDADCGGLMSYGYLSGEPITGFEEGRPLFMRKPDSRLTLANFMRTHLYSSLATLKYGMDIMFKEENVSLDKLMGHGGFFKTKGVGQRIMAAAADVPVAVMETAGEGGAWGIALLAAYRKDKKEGESLSDYLNQYVFADAKEEVMEPDAEDVKGFDSFVKDYIKGLAAEKGAVEGWK